MGTYLLWCSYTCGKGQRHVEAGGHGLGLPHLGGRDGDQVEM